MLSIAPCLSSFAATPPVLVRYQLLLLVLQVQVKYQRHCSFKTLDFGVFLLWGNYGFHRSITECGLSIPDAVEIAGL